MSGDNLAFAIFLLCMGTALVAYLWHHPLTPHDDDEADLDAYPVTGIGRQLRKDDCDE